MKSVFQSEKKKKTLCQEESQISLSLTDKRTVNQKNGSIFTSIEEFSANFEDIQLHNGCDQTNRQSCQKFFYSF